MIDPAVLPDPVSDFDPDNVSFVNLDVFTDHANNLAMGSAYAPPGGIDAAESGDKQALINFLNSKRAGMLLEVNNEIAAIQNIKTTLSAVTTMTQEMLNDYRQELASGNPDADRANFLGVAIAYSEAAIELGTNLVVQLQTQISFLNNFKTTINETFDTVIDTIKEFNMSPDPDPEAPYIPWFLSDEAYFV